MSKLIHNRLTAPGRMDVVEKILKHDPYFIDRLRAHGQFDCTNRRGVTKHYSGLTVAVVMKLAELGLDAARMRRDEIIAKAFLYCEGKTQQVMAA